MEVVILTGKNFACDRSDEFLNRRTLEGWLDLLFEDDMDAHGEVQLRCEEMLLGSSDGVVSLDDEVAKMGVSSDRLATVFVEAQRKVAECRRRRGRSASEL